MRHGARYYDLRCRAADERCCCDGEAVALMRAIFTLRDDVIDAAIDVVTICLIRLPPATLALGTLLLICALIFRDTPPRHIGIPDAVPPLRHAITLMLIRHYLLHALMMLC